MRSLCGSGKVLRRGMENQQPSQGHADNKGRVSSRAQHLELLISAAEVYKEEGNAKALDLFLCNVPEDLLFDVMKALGRTAAE